MISQKHFWWCKYKWYGLLSILISSPNICIFNWRQCFAMGYLYHMQPNKSGFIAILHKHSLLLLVSHYYKIIPCGRMSVHMTYQFPEFTVLGGSIRRQNRVMQQWPDRLDRLDMSPSHLFHYSLLLLLPATFPSRHTFDTPYLLRMMFLWSYSVPLTKRRTGAIPFVYRRVCILMWCARRADNAHNVHDIC